jgi:hypothetical protein
MNKIYAFQPFPALQSAIMSDKQITTCDVAFDLHFMHTATAAICPL